MAREFDIEELKYYIRRIEDARDKGDIREAEDELGWLDSEVDRLEQYLKGLRPNPLIKFRDKIRDLVAAFNELPEKVPGAQESKAHESSGHEIDAHRLKFTGEPFVLADHVAAGLNRKTSDFSVSTNGMLAWRMQSTARQLAWFDRSGKQLEELDAREQYIYPFCRRMGTGSR